MSLVFTKASELVNEPIHELGGKRWTKAEYEKIVKIIYDER